MPMYEKQPPVASSGMGMIEVPKRATSRKHLEEKFKTDFKAAKIALGDDIPF